MILASTDVCGLCRTIRPARGLTADHNSNPEKLHMVPPSLSAAAKPWHKVSYTPQPTWPSSPEPPRIHFSGLRSNEGSLPQRAINSDSPLLWHGVSTSQQRVAAANSSVRPQTTFNWPISARHSFRSRHHVSYPCCEHLTAVHSESEPVCEDGKYFCRSHISASHGCATDLRRRKWFGRGRGHRRSVLVAHNAWTHGDPGERFFCEPQHG